MARVRVLSASAADALVTGFLADGVGGDVNAAITKGSGYFVSTRKVLSRPQLDAVAASRTLTARFNKILVNVSRVGVDQLRKLTKPWRTGAFRSSWRIERIAERGAPSSLRTRLIVVNPVPYAGYVHERGTSRKNTVVKRIVPVTLNRMNTELRADLTSGAFARDLKASLLASSNLGRR